MINKYDQHDQHELLNRFKRIFYIIKIVASNLRIWFFLYTGQTLQAQPYKIYWCIDDDLFAYCYL